MLNSSLTFKGIELTTDFSLPISDPLIKVIASNFSQVTLSRINMTLQIPLILNSIPIALSILDTILTFTPSIPYLINSKHSDPSNTTFIMHSSTLQ